MQHQRERERERPAVVQKYSMEAVDGSDACECENKIFFKKNHWRKDNKIIESTWAFLPL